MNLIKILLVLLFGMIASRAFFLSVLLRTFYASEAASNRVSAKVIEAQMGVIRDRNGKILANNISSNEKTVRHYPDGESFSILQLVEKQYSGELVGTDGKILTEESAKGEATKEIRRIEPVGGTELRINIDQGLQNVVYRALRDHLAITGVSGSVVVAKINGEVLSLVSLPSFDPNLFVSGGKRGAEGGTYTDSKSIISDENKKPMFNRVVAGVYPPGSIYKLVTAVAALEEGVINENTFIEDTGEIKVGEYRYGNWYFDKYGRKEGSINVEKALGRSNDIFFYKAGEKVGIDKLVWWSEKLGLGKKTGIDLPSEASGLLPTPLWMEKTNGQRWFLGNTYHMAIGQGDLLTTPLQMNRTVAAVISGEWCTPQLKIGKPECRQVGTSAENRQIIINGMRMVCMEGGTGYTFFDLKGKVYCKTGTAQHGGEDTKPHAWITVVVNEDIVITVLLEAAGEGSAEAGPVARKIVDYLLRKI